MIDPKHLRLIIAIDKFGSLNKASKELNLTQSALSHQLRNLEDNLRLRIFHRIGNKLLFTEAGKELKDRAEIILLEIDKIESRIIEIRENDKKGYVHGYSQREAKRLLDQATTVADYLHYDSIWEKGSRVLEVGCGIGAQTEIIAKMNLDSQFTSIDISKDSIEAAKLKFQKSGINNVKFRVQDILKLAELNEEPYDHIFVCFVLEHMNNPIEVLNLLRTVLKPKGTITVIEGDHGSTLFYPKNLYTNKVIEAQVELQKRRGGNANIGRELYPLLNKSGFKNIRVNPRQIYVDNSKLKLVEGFIRNTFTAMIQGISEEIISAGILTELEFNKGMSGLLDTTEEHGVFSYTFFKAIAQY